MLIVECIEEKEKHTEMYDQIFAYEAQIRVWVASGGTRQSNFCAKTGIYR